ncbi:MAG: MEDS domain-containing protein [Gammaproteobacteria bacterium]
MTNQGVISESHDAIRFGGVKFSGCPHMCAFFHGMDEEYRVLLPFIKEGIERGEKIFHTFDMQQQAAYLQRLGLVGIDPAVVMRSGQLQLRDWHDVYLHNSHFDKSRMLKAIPEILEQGRQQGFPLTRLIAHCEWYEQDWPGANDFMEYEARLNYILPQYRDPVLCVYDPSKCRGEIIIDVMRTHPLVIIGGILHENPFFVPPDEFLRDLGARKA